MSAFVQSLLASSLSSPLSPDVVVAAGAASLWLAAAGYVALAMLAIPAKSIGRMIGKGKDEGPVSPHWFSRNPAKYRTEVSFLAAAPLWIAVMAVVIVTKAFESFGPWEYMYVTTAVVAPCVVVPPIVETIWGGGQTRNPGVPHYVKAHLWLGILTFVGSYFWTHYFYSLLGAYYTFDAHRCVTAAELRYALWPMLCTKAILYRVRVASEYSYWCVIFAA